MRCGPGLQAGEPAVHKVFAAGEVPPDSRLGEQRTLNTFHQWTPPTTKAAWERESTRMRQQILVSNGLWPMPVKHPLKPVIHGKIDRGDYTVEKVFFASHPGHYVSGNLYKPKKIEGKIPGVLSPHGHWANGRFYDAGEKKAIDQLGKGAEEFMSGARFPLQARMAHLARMGCVVFHYDMVGNADSKQFAHRAGFTDAEAGLRLQNFMGLQTFNSIRALDFLLSLPEVDAERIGVTGASGGGTQTFMIGAIDPRPAVAFPAVMVSTEMQGGCVCENAELLRLGLNNVAVAALFAPRPLAMSGADDWTVRLETRGLPELKQVYSHYGKASSIQVSVFAQFKHNYNQGSREVMYAWFNEHLQLGYADVANDQDFWPIDPKNLTVYDAKHPLPDDAKSSEQLRESLTEASNQQFTKLIPKNKEQLAEYRRVVGTAAGVMLDSGKVEEIELETSNASEEPFGDELKILRGTLSRKGAGEAVPYVALVPETFNGKAVLWVNDKGKSHLFDELGEPTAAVNRLLTAGIAVTSVDVFLTGEYLVEGKTSEKMKVDSRYQGYTYGYNRTVLANRVRDILTVLAGMKKVETVQQIDLVGTGKAGPWVALARALAGPNVNRTVADLGDFSFSNVKSADDPMFLPGGLKYGDLPGLIALAAPANLTLAGVDKLAMKNLAPLLQVYGISGGSISLSPKSLSADEAAAILLK